MSFLKSVVGFLCFAILSVELSNAFSGDATHFRVGLGACGWRNTNTQYVAALNGAQYSRQACGQCVNVYGNGGSVKVQIVDKCPGCRYGDLDLSPAAFGRLASLRTGRINIEWNWC